MAEVEQNGKERHTRLWVVMTAYIAFRPSLHPLSAVVYMEKNRDSFPRVICPYWGLSLITGLMASSSEKCCFCSEIVENPRNGWHLKDSTYAQLCHICSASFEQGTFCDRFHGHEDGWRNCDACGKLVHCGCIMGLNTFELNDTCGVTCKKCVTKEIPGESGIGASSFVPNSKDCFQLENSGSSTDILPVGTELSTDLGSAKPLNDVLKNVNEATIEGSSKMSEPLESGLLFLFAKKLAPTDCDIKAGRFLVPKKCAEKFFPQTDGSQSTPLPVEDTEGRSWLFVLRWWHFKKSRKYVLDGTRKCIETMQWNAGDILKFYRKLADGKFIIELGRTLGTSSASDAPVPGN